MVLWYLSTGDSVVEVVVTVTAPGAAAVGDQQRGKSLSFSGSPTFNLQNKSIFKL